MHNACDQRLLDELQGSSGLQRLAGREMNGWAMLLDKASKPAPTWLFSQRIICSLVCSCLEHSSSFTLKAPFSSCRMLYVSEVKDSVRGMSEAEIDSDITCVPLMACIGQEY